MTVVDDPATSEQPEPTAPAIRAAVPESDPATGADADVRTAPIGTVPDTLEAAPATIPTPEPEPFSPSGRSVEPRVQAALLSAIDGFVGVDDGREPFRKVWIAIQLAE